MVCFVDSLEIQLQSLPRPIARRVGAGVMVGDARHFQLTAKVWGALNVAFAADSLAVVRCLAVNVFDGDAYVAFIRNCRLENDNGASRAVGSC